MARLRYNGLRTTLGASLTNSATSVTFAAALTHSNGTNVPTITGSDYIPLAILDSSGHLSEIVWLTAYASGATTGTIARGKEGTTGVTHSSGDVVICSIFAADMVPGGILLLETTDTVANVPPSTPVGTVLFRKALAAVVYDFTAGALPAGWSKHGSPTETFSGSGMAATMPANAGYDCAIPAALSGKNITVDMEFSVIGSLSGVMLGPSITDATGAGAGATLYNSPAGTLVVGLAGWAYNSSYQTESSTAALTNGILRVKQMAGTSYLAFSSYDGGATWNPSTNGTALTATATPAKIGINAHLGSNTVTVKKVTVRDSTATTAAPIGWWDGSAIQPLASS